MTPKLCTIEGCERLHLARGWCPMHYARWKRTGDPLTVKYNYGGDPSVRFWSKVKTGLVSEYRPDLGQCWLWTGGTNKAGYGIFQAHGKAVNAHRFAWTDVGRDLPDGLVLDHLCRVLPCVRPLHLDPVTNQENVIRGLEAKRQLVSA